MNSSILIKKRNFSRGYETISKCETKHIEKIIGGNVQQRWTAVGDEEDEKKYEKLFASLILKQEKTHADGERKNE